MSDLNTKRGHVLGMEPDGSGFTTVTAQTPLVEVQRYNTDLRSLSQGRGTFSQKHAHYAEVPLQLSQKLVQAAKQEHEAQLVHH